MATKEERKELNKKYLEEKFWTITRSLTVDLLDEKPDNVVITFV